VNALSAANNFIIRWCRNGGRGKESAGGDVSPAIGTAPSWLLVATAASKWISVDVVLNIIFLNRKLVKVILYKKVF
jgi:hypothetical protein